MGDRSPCLSTACASVHALMISRYVLGLVKHVGAASALTPGPASAGPEPLSASGGGAASAPGGALGSAGARLHPSDPSEAARAQQRTTTARSCARISARLAEAV